MVRILVAEDEPTILMLARSILEESGHEVLTASDGEQAIALLADGERLDALVTDINMGDGRDGFAVADVSQQRADPPKVIYTSGQALTDGLRARLVEGSVFLPKPYDVDDLVQAVRDALGS